MLEDIACALLRILVRLTSKDAQRCISRCTIAIEHSCAGDWAKSAIPDIFYMDGDLIHMQVRGSNGNLP